MSYQIVTDSTCDLSQELADSLNILAIPMDVTIDEKVFSHYLDYRNYDYDVFYAKLANGSLASTSQINPNKYIEAFKPLLEKGLDVLYIAFSSGLSSTYQSSMIAKKELEEDYPDRKIMVIDSLAASGGEGLMVYTAAINKQNGMNIDDNANWIEANKLNFAHWFTVDDLMFLKRGGRVSNTTAIVGSALKIKPILHVDNEGHLINMSKAHGRRASINVLVETLQKTITDPFSHPVFINHGNCLADALYLKSKIMEVAPIKDEDIHILQIGPVIGCHTGPGILALFFYAKNR